MPLISSITANRVIGILETILTKLDRNEIKQSVREVIELLEKVNRSFILDKTPLPLPINEQPHIEIVKYIGKHPHSIEKETLWIARFVGTDGIRNISHTVGQRNKEIVYNEAEDLARFLNLRIIEIDLGQTPIEGRFGVPLPYPRREPEKYFDKTSSY